MFASCGALGDRLRELLDAAIPAGSRVALLDYPNHENVGDSAIWLGEVTYLAERGCEVVYHCDLRSYDPGQLRRRLPVDLVLLHGGGNLGDVWLPHQRFREQVLADFYDRPVIQLPQTIHFGGGEHLERAQRAFAGHPDFTLMVRDTRSLAFAREHFDCPVVLCPDSAFALGELARPAAPDVPILWLGRTDHEAAAGTAAGLGAAAGEVEIADWIGRTSAGPLDLIARAGGELVASAVGRLPAAPAWIARPLWADWQWLAQRRVTVGQTLLSRGSVVVTDRLHAHILCLLLGLPHVALDNSYGKLSSFTETWETLGEQARWADDPVQALALARELRVAQGAT
jgi:pyruvyl transferase EpsO